LALHPMVAIAVMAPPIQAEAEEEAALEEVA
jgi:hypothetical protein